MQMMIHGLTVNPRTEFSKYGNLEIPGNPETWKWEIRIDRNDLDFSRFPIPEFQWNSIGIDFLWTSLAWLAMVRGPYFIAGSRV